MTDTFFLEDTFLFEFIAFPTFQVKGPLFDGANEAEAAPTIRKDAEREIAILTERLDHVSDGSKLALEAVQALIRDVTPKINAVIRLLYNDRFVDCRGLKGEIAARTQDLDRITREAEARLKDCPNHD